MAEKHCGPLLQCMMNAAKCAGDVVRKCYLDEGPQTIIEKSGPNDLCTSTDLASQKIIQDLLNQTYPKVFFVGEEESTPQSRPDGNYWLVDPLDGTMNFVRKIPIFAINIALVSNGEPVAGVTYLPMADELFHAEKGKGAFLNSRPISVSCRSELSDCTVAVGIPFKGKPKHRQFSSEMNHLTPRLGQLRRLGACAVEMAYVACGRLDAYWEQSVSPWDIAAGTVLVREAGGIACNTTGGALDLHQGTCLVTTPQVQSELVKLLLKASEGLEISGKP